MISVIIPTLNAELHLGSTLLSLMPAALQGLAGEVIVADGGSEDGTAALADGWGATVIVVQRGRGIQLAEGARQARKPWLLFLHADTKLESGWERETEAFIAAGNRGAAAFRFRLDDSGFRPRLLEAAVATRMALFKLPYGDQGLLISRALYNEIGGFAPMPIMEDVDIIRRVRRKQLTIFKAAAVTSAERYRREGYARRSIRNLRCLVLYFCGVPPQRIAAAYD